MPASCTQTDVGKEKEHCNLVKTFVKLLLNLRAAKRTITVQDRLHVWLKIYLIHPCNQIKIYLHHQIMVNTTRKTTYCDQGSIQFGSEISLRITYLPWIKVDTVDILRMVIPPWIGSPGQFVNPCYWGWLATTVHIGIWQVKLWSCRQICRRLVVAGDQHHELTIECINISWTFNAEGMAFNSSSCWAMHNLSMKTITGRLVMSRRKRCQKPFIPAQWFPCITAIQRRFLWGLFTCEMSWWLWSSLIHCSMCLPEMSTAANIRYLLPVCVANV